MNIIEANHAIQSSDPVAIDTHSGLHLLRSEEPPGLYFLANGHNGKVLTTLTADHIIKQMWRGHLREL